MILFFGALLGLTSVLLGAFLRHSVQAKISSLTFESLMIALNYHQTYAVVISCIGLVLLFGSAKFNKRWLTWSAILFIAGTIMFSFSIYANILGNISVVSYLSPFGGLVIMAAWLLLAIIGLKFLNNN